MEIGKRKKDWTGNRFGMWVVKEFRGRIGSNYRWLCICDCGTEREVYESSLVKEASRCCGCSSMDIRKETLNGAEPFARGTSGFIDMAGQTVGLLTVLERDNKKRGRNGGVIWKCRCQCGKIVSVGGQELRNGTTKSCGCWHTVRHAAAQQRIKLPGFTLWKGAKSRAQERGLDFNLEIEDIVIPEVCPILGLPLVRGKGMGAKDSSPTLDRILQSKGYTKDNVWVISWKANRIKNDATLEELEKIASELRKKMEEIHAV